MKIKNLTVKKSEKTILNNVNIDFEQGKIHTIMGSNGCGKTTLSSSIVNHPDCNITDGTIEYNNLILNSLSIHDIALNGIFLAPQYPIVINGLSHAAFLKQALNSKLKYENKDELDEFEFLKLLREKASEFDFEPKSYIRHSLNSGYSGGEKKRNELLQISILKPKFIILDEIDSGLDIESMKKMAQFIKNYTTPETTILAITHHPSFAKLIGSSIVHIMKNGQFVHTGNESVIDEVEKNGFGAF